LNDGNRKFLWTSIAISYQPLQAFILGRGFWDQDGDLDLVFLAARLAPFHMPTESRQELPIFGKNDANGKF